MANAFEVVTRVRQVINDVASTFITSVRWTDEELLLWMTDAQREIVKIKPEAYPVTEVFQTVDTVPRQRLDPTTAYRLIRVEANAAAIGEEGFRYGTAIRYVERDVLDSFFPGWTVEGSSDLNTGEYFSAYCMDANDPLAFWLAPLPNGARVWLTYAGIPPLLESASDSTPSELVLSDMYIAPVVDYTVYRALLKESREANREVAERYLRAFYAALGVHRPILMSIGQNAARAPEAKA